MKYLIWLLLLVQLGGGAQSVAAQSVSARNTFKVGRTCFDKGDYKRALEYFEKAIKEDGTYSDAHFMAGLAYLGLKDYDKAADKLKYCIQIDPMFLPGYQYLGNVYLQQKKYREAKEHFNRMLSVPKAGADATYCLGVLAYAQKDLKEAERLWKEALRMDPKLVKARFNLGVLALDGKRYPEALSSFQEASRMMPDNPNYQLFQGIVLVETGNKIGARAALDRVKRHADKRHDLGFFGVALDHYLDGRFEKCVEACDAALTRNEDLTWAMIFKARSLEQLKKTKEALKAYQDALDSDPNLKEAEAAVGRLGAAASPTPSPTSTPSPIPAATSTPKAKP